MHLLDLFRTHPAALYAAAALLGLVVGSFLNVVIHRLPKMMEREWRRDCRALLGLEPDVPHDEVYDLIRPRSRCPHCGHPIRAIENIPVASWLFLRGRCSACHVRIPVRYPLVETLTAALTVLVVWHFGATLHAVAGLTLTWALIALTGIDLDCQLLPDDITLPLLWLGLVCNLFGMFTDLPSAVLGAVAGYLMLWSVYVAFKALTGKEGMGYGDFKLLAMLGAWTGWQMLPLIIILSSVVGSIVAVLLLVRGHERSQPIPFGPYLAAAGWIALLWGVPLTRGYLSWATAA
jgi:leader peptidase (prepilin peptidase)/N-methyltransferase